MTTCPEGPCLSKSAEEVQLKANERQFLNRFYSTQITLQAGEAEELDIYHNIFGKNAALEIWIYVPQTATDVRVRLNRQTDSDFNVALSLDQPVKFQNIMVDYLRLYNAGNQEDVTVTVWMATYLSRRIMQQVGMEGV